MAFNDTLKSYDQEHFTIIEIDVPAVSGTCTLGSNPGFGTALTCEQPPNTTKTYRFTTENAPLLPVSEVYRCVTSINENTAELQSGRGLALSASLSISLDDFKGDPNPLAPAVNATIKAQGTFFGKLAARNILQNRPLRIINYRIVDGQLPDLDNDGEIRHYFVETFASAGAGKWKIKGKDELAKLEFGDKEWPPTVGGFLRQGIDNITTTFPVDSVVQYESGMYIRINKEICQISSVSNIGQSNASVTVFSRSPVTALTSSERDSHNAGDEIFICKGYNNAKITDVLYDIITESGIPPERIPFADWEAEIDQWHNQTRVTTLFAEAEDSNDQLKRMLTSYMVDMWFDPVERLIRLSAISVWRGSSTTLSEGVEINYDSVKVNQEEGLRATDSVVVYDKPFKARNDDIENYRKVSLYSNPELSSDSFYGEVKQKRFDNNFIIDVDAAQLLTVRYVARYGVMPISYMWTTEENKRVFSVGDVVDIKTLSNVGFDGLPGESSRAQITQIKPVYSKIGRQYKVKALTYDPAISTGGDINDFPLFGDFQNLNLYNLASGGIDRAVDVTFILKGGKVSSTSASIAGMRAGPFPPGSTITLILVDGAEIQAKGGVGGRGAPVTEIGAGAPSSGGNGGICLDTEGFDFKIYLSGATGNSDYPEANGFIRAPGGGGAGGFASGNAPGEGGGGGAGSVPGNGGAGGFFLASGIGTDGEDGEDGTENGTGGDGARRGGNWGEDGESWTDGTRAVGGLSGKGIVKTTNTVTVYGATPSRLINGRGDSYTEGA
jgi:hypothetical protein